jgi:hypothetical protein
MSTRFGDHMFELRQNYSGGASGGGGVESLEQLVSGELDLLVAPLGGAVVTGDQPDR